MPATRDRFPGTRTEQLAMAKNWGDILGRNAAAWNIPCPAVTELTAPAGAAEAALTEAQNEATRTPVATAKCKEAFETVAASMRDIKKRYLYVPPLSNADLISVGLKPHDATPTPSGPPAAQTTIETYLVGRHELGVKIVYVTGNPAGSANKGYRIWYSVTTHGETPPENPDDLKRSFYTKRKKDVIEFEFTDSGKTVCMAVQIENEGRKGPWGPRW